MVDDFNNNKFNVLVLTRAGGEGIDLKGVRSVIVLDPTWNDAGLQQIVGRAIRFNSHAHLPPAERKVDVYFMLLTKPEGETDDVTMPTGDKILYSIIVVATSFVCFLSMYNLPKNFMLSPTFIV